MNKLQTFTVTKEELVSVVLKDIGANSALGISVQGYPTDTIILKGELVEEKGLGITLSHNPKPQEEATCSYGCCKSPQDVCLKGNPCSNPHSKDKPQPIENIDISALAFDVPYEDIEEVARILNKCVDALNDIRK